MSIRLKSNTSRPRVSRGRLVLSGLLTLAAALSTAAAPYTPSQDGAVLAHVPPGTTHSSVPARQAAAERLDVALPLAQFYISQARSSGDLRFLGYAEAVLASWMARVPIDPSVLVLHATIQQSRHAFEPSLQELDAALSARPDDLQAWLTRATVLRVMGRYDEARASCERLQPAADDALVQLCTQSVRAVSGQLRSAYLTLRELPQQSLSNEARAWRYSQLGEMAQALGENDAAAHWFGECLVLTPDDTYTRAAFADLLLDQGRPAQVLTLLHGSESIEPLLLRIGIAEARLHDSRLAATRALLAEAFSVEELRGEAVHRREQARFLLDVEGDAGAALRAAQRNWQVQREPADLLILLRAADAAHQPSAAGPAEDFARTRGIEDVRVARYLKSST
jgi:tetratricopeptide (TPR) repeat protein